MYPSLLRRAIATLIDALVAFGLAYSVARILPVRELVWLRVGGAVAVAMLYEPLLTASACTVGQAVMRTRVREAESMRRIAVRNSYMRFFAKYIVGLVAGAVNTRRDDMRANHDLVAGTVVVTADSAQEAAVVHGG